MKRLPIFLAAFAMSLSSLAVLAEVTQDAVKKPATDVAASADTTPMTEGEVKKIDKDTGKITIKHGEIKNLDMPSMTMVFRVKEAAMLDQLKVGDKINFSAADLNGKLTVTKVEVAK